MAALRLIYRDPIVRAWYRKKVARDGGRTKIKAVVAVTRKLVLALWHVARGEAFDASKLFDARRLDRTSSPYHPTRSPSLRSPASPRAQRDSAATCEPSVWC